jgi:short-subunit dehydrogenase
MELTRLVIPVMRKQNQGRIINLSSVLGVISLPLKGAYNASKYAVEGLSDTLRLELKPAGIKVITIEPGPIESLWSNTLTDSFNNIETQDSVFKDQYEALRVNATQKKSNSFFTKKASAVTNKLIHAIEATCPRAKYRVTFVAGLLIFLKRILPTKVLDSFLLLVSKFN